MTPVRVLGACGLVSAALSALGGCLNRPTLIGVAGLVMLVANLYALIAGRKGSS